MLDVNEIGNCYSYSSLFNQSIKVKIIVSMSFVFQKSRFLQVKWWWSLITGMINQLYTISVVRYIYIYMCAYLFSPRITRQDWGKNRLRKKVIIDRQKKIPYEKNNNLRLSMKTWQSIISDLKCKEQKKKQQASINHVSFSIYYSNNRLKILLIIQRDLISLVLYVFK